MFVYCDVLWCLCITQFNSLLDKKLPNAVTLALVYHSFNVILQEFKLVPEFKRSSWGTS